MREFVQKESLFVGSNWFEKKEKRRWKKVKKGERSKMKEREGGDAVSTKDER